MEKSRFVRYEPSVHEVMRHLMSELTQRSNRGQLVPTSLRRSELQYDLFIPVYEVDSWVYRMYSIHSHEIPRRSSVSNSMADHLKILGFVGRIVTRMFVRDKRVQLPRNLSYKLGRSLFNKVGTANDQKTDEDFVPARYLNEYSRVAETRHRKLQLEVGSTSMPHSENKRKRVTPRKRCLKDY